MAFRDEGEVTAKILQTARTGNRIVIEGDADSGRGVIQFYPEENAPVDLPGTISSWDQGGQEHLLIEPAVRVGGDGLPALQLDSGPDADGYAQLSAPTQIDLTAGVGDINLLAGGNINLSPGGNVFGVGEIGYNAVMYDQAPILAGGGTGNIANTGAMWTASAYGGASTVLFNVGNHKWMRAKWSVRAIAGGNAAGFHECLIDNVVCDRVRVHNHANVNRPLDSIVEGWKAVTPGSAVNVVLRMSADAGGVSYTLNECSLTISLGK